MIVTLRIECVRGRYLEEDWVRIVEIDSSSTLYSIHELILKAIGFDHDHLFEFVAGRREGHRQLVFDDSGESAGNGLDTTIEEVFPLEKNLHLYYHYDFGDEWYFKISKSRAKPKEPEPRVKYPRIIERVGRNPRQYG